MIAVHYIDGLACPFFACDVCGRRVADVALGMAAWGEDDAELRQAGVTAAHVHKGPCLDAFEARLPAGKSLMTAELAEHVEHLLHNCAVREGAA